MPLNSRDILLIVRAKDEASTVIRNVGRSFGTLDTDARIAAAGMMAAGSALLSVGAGMVATGIGFARMTADWVATAQEYSRQAALTLTQVDQLGVSLEDIKAIGLEVAREIPVPFEEIQKGLYDIFSSLDVNATDATTILKAFSKGAVAGQTTLEAAGRSTIAVLNAYGFTAADINKVMDVQFQLVRKGVGTYEEFATTLGLALPAAQRSGQQFETMAGMLAFLTRNGLSASQAATSAARAMENLAKPEVVNRMKFIGVEVLNADGSFRQMDEIVRDLAGALDGLTDAERAGALNEIFKGQGNNIQARRFWDTAIKSFEDLTTLTDAMDDSAGALDSAYDIMFGQGATQAQALDNALQATKVTLGEALMPAVEALRAKGIELLNWFLDLNPEVQKFVAYAAAGAAVLFTVVGVLSMLSGAILLIGGAIKMLGGLGTLISLGVPILLVIAAIAAAAYVIYRNWDTIKKWWDKYWPGIKKTVEDVWEWMKKTWEDLWPRIKAVAEAVLNWLVSTWNTVWPALKATVEAVWNWIMDVAPEVWAAFQTAWEIGQQVVDAIIAAFGWLYEKVYEVYMWFDSEFGPGISRIFEAVGEHLVPIIQGIIDIIQALWDRVEPILQVMEAGWRWLFDMMWGVIQAVWPHIYSVISTTIENIWDVIDNVLKILWAAWELAWGQILNIITTVWDFISIIIAEGLQIFRGLVDFVAGVLTGDWSRAWDGIKNIFGGVWDLIKGILTTAIDFIKSAIMGLWTFMVTTFIQIKNGVLEIMRNLLDWFIGLPGRILGTLGDLSGLLYDVGKDIIQGLWDGMKNIWNKATGWIGGLAGKIVDLKGPPAYDKVFMKQTGEWIMQGLHGGMQDEWTNIERWLGSLAPSMETTFTAGGQPGTSLTSTSASGAAGAGVYIAEGAVQVVVQGDGDETRIRSAVQEVLREVLVEAQVRGVSYNA